MFVKQIAFFKNIEHSFAFYFFFFTSLPLGWFYLITTPEPSTLVFRSFRLCLSLIPLNKGLPNR
jgi:hypothetical protein